MRPFLLISIRAEQAAADDEYDAFLRFTGLDEATLPRVDVHAHDLPALDLDAWSGVVLGGGPWNASDDPATKSAVQLRAEDQLGRLLDEVEQRDFPFLGACYGIGTLGLHRGGVVDRSFPEPVGPLSVTLTDEGLRDPLFAGVPRAFAAYGGHKESMTTLPPGAVLLATSEACPVQAFRVGENGYATQFHPELDVDGVCTRIEVYRHAGYFPPQEAQALTEVARSVEVLHPMTVLANFVARHAR
ncbi:GMP synthase (glutamine-hydrolysing) [Nocardioides scoriae]|uniref:GMP synthase (Glutamine-hydrolysing) n=1 Tax=Nocardioides scoriae TaxID=642780 RepID=A0A1H1T7F1_9ACTN|nr:glutamine amidotransferase [Nocardioides scoriae]SDS56132.1 GMP synthase (glutamine-hydrolysing) [Nocardioides scoriae]